MRPSRHCERSAAIQRVTRGGGWIAAEAVPSRNDGERGGCGGVLRRRVALRQLRRVQESAPYGVFAGDASASGLPRRLRLLAMTGRAGRLWRDAAAKRGAELVYTSSALTGTFPSRGRLLRQEERGVWIAAEAAPPRNDGERGAFVEGCCGEAG